MKRATVSPPHLRLPGFDLAGGEGGRAERAFLLPA